MARPGNPAKPTKRKTGETTSPVAASAALNPESTPEQDSDPKRGADGKWLPGQSPNPGGRPKSAGRMRELAAQYGDKALLTLVALLDHKDYRARLGAAEALLNRGFGRPAQSVDITFTQADLAAAISGLTDDEKRAVALGDLRPLASRR